ncbi:MAG: pyridoxamine 5'-phosphate oxidase family protein [Rhizobiaceae bacterium]|nr:pyridoxamine 5'-phosphate oxidase family protein [Rhizobiaceae bacterium]
MNHRVESIEQLEALYPGKVAEASWRKETAQITPEYRQLIEAAPFFAIASIGGGGEGGGMDCSPRGDGPGCVKILDPKSVAFADRRGNNRLDTLRNIVQDPRVALLFLIPGWNECLRINGRASITTDPELLDGFAVADKRPVTAVVVNITTMYFQCARAIKRAALWDEASKVDPKSLPTAGRLVKSAMQDFDAESYDAALQERQAKTMY